MVKGANGDSREASTGCTSLNNSLYFNIPTPFDPISLTVHFFPGGGGRIYLFLDCIFEGEGMRFRGYEIYINEGKFDEFYVKKQKIESSNFKISYGTLKKM